MRCKKIYIITVIILSCAASFSQCVDENRAFKIGEEIRYYAYYNWGKVWIKAGEASFCVSESNDNYLFTVKAKNLPGWDWLYRLRTTHEAEMTKELKPVFLRASTIENKTWSNVEYRYKGDQIYKRFSNNNHPKGGDTTYIYTPCSWDIINAVYIARNVDIRSFKMEKQIPFYLNFDEKTHTIYGKVLKKERIKNREGEEFDCLKCSATVVSGTIFSENKPVYFWITDDVRQIPVLIESQISIGSIKIFLYNYKEGQVMK